MEGWSAVLRHPALWVEAVRTAAALARPGWWRRPPFLPRPDPKLLAWRMATAYGSPSATAAEGDLVAYLRWRRRSRADD